MATPSSIHAEIESPLGKLTLASDGDALTSVRF